MQTTSLREQFSPGFLILYEDSANRAVFRRLQYLLKRVALWIHRLGLEVVVKSQPARLRQESELTHNRLGASAGSSPAPA